MNRTPTPTIRTAPAADRGPSTDLGRGSDSRKLERRGRAWLIWSFLFCPCHLPLSLGVLAAVLSGTALGGVMRDNALAAGVMITITWLAGTGYGLTLIRRAERANGACPIRQR